MDLDLIRSYREATEPGPDRTPAGSGGSNALDEWRGTGLCAQAQADGVPCNEAGRSCDICSRADADPAFRKTNRW